MEREMKATVGLEIHVRLDTGGKLFCPCEYRFAAPANSQVCPVCLGLPGSLPVLQPLAVELALKTGLALGCQPNLVSEFARKNYFYPDLPRNYQITQYQRPLFGPGALTLPEADERPIRIRRLHLEEDAGRSLLAEPKTSRVDANRAGVPLAEIVTEPDLRNGQEARAWLRHLLQILRYVKVCDGRLAEGSLRVDANIGLIESSEYLGPPLVEIKNLNSLKGIQLAIDFEIDRLERARDEGQTLARQTRNWDAAKGCTHFMRFKEETSDYRFFPEPDLPLLNISESKVKDLLKNQPELPRAKETRYRDQWGMRLEHAQTICRHEEVAKYFELVLNEAPHGKLDSPHWVALSTNWVMGPILAAREQWGWEAVQERLPFAVMGEVLLHLAEHRISDQVAKEILEKRIAEKDPRSPGTMMTEEGWALITDADYLRDLVGQVFDQYPDQVMALKSGQDKFRDYLMGRAMKAAKGKIDPVLVREIINDEIKKT